MTNTSKGEGSQHQTKRHIERDSLLVQRMTEPKFYPFSTASSEVSFSLNSPTGRDGAGNLPIVPSRELRVADENGVREDLWRSASLQRTA
jgi:hypothetical protein